MAILFNRRVLLAVAAGFAQRPVASIAQAAADYPNHAVRLVVPFGAGSGTDFVVRVLAQELQLVLGTFRGREPRWHQRQHRIECGRPRGRRRLHAAPIHTFDTLVADPHLQDIGFFRDEEIPGIGTILETAVPSEWHGTPPGDYRPPPLPGEHSTEVLEEIGLGREEIDRLVDAGVVARGPA